MTRNTGNSSVVLDGSYYEVPALNGLGTVIRFNSSTGSSRGILIVSNGILYERPSGSISATIEHLNGQLVNMAGYVATLASQSVNTILGGAPSYVDLAAFGNKVYAAGLFPLGGVIPVMSHLTGSYSLPTSGSVDSNGYMRCNGAVIPSGLVLSGTTPDLTGGRFIYGTSGSGSGANFLAGATGGQSSVTLVTANVPGHTHGFTTTAHTHTFSFSGASGTAAAQSWSGSVSGSISGGDYNIGAALTLGQLNNCGLVNGTGPGPNWVGDNYTRGPQTNPSFSGSVSGSNSSSAVTGVSGSGTTGGTGTSGTTDTGSGSSTAFSILPPYVAAVYLIRVN